MKKLNFTVLFSVLALTLFAQSEQTYKLGDLIEKDGIKAVVVYVDESGQHGLMLSPQGFFGDECYEKDSDKKFNATKEKENTIKNFEAQQKFAASIVKRQLKKECKKTGKDYNVEYDKYLNALHDTLEMQLELIDMVEKMPRLTCYTQQTEKEWNEMYKNILSSNSEYGKENTQAIFDYCLKNNVSMQDWFPAYYWVSQLGEDWFIPGAHELELLGLQFVDKIGGGAKYWTVKTEKIMEQRAKYNVYNHNWKFIKCVYPWAEATAGMSFFGMTHSSPMLIESSTLSKSSWGVNSENKDKIEFDGGGTLIGTLAGAIDKDVNIHFLTFYYGLTEKYGWQSFFLTNASSYYCAMAEF